MIFLDITICATIRIADSFLNLQIVNCSNGITTGICLHYIKKPSRAQWQVLVVTLAEVNIHHIQLLHWCKYELHEPHKRDKVMNTLYIL